MASLDLKCVSLLQKEGDQKITSSVGGRLTTYTQTGLAAGQEYHVSITGEKDGQPGAESSTEFITSKKLTLTVN